MSGQATKIVSPGEPGEDQLSVVEVLDHVLNRGVVVRGSVVISLAGVDLVYLGLDAILTSFETAVRHIAMSPPKPSKP